MRAILFGLAALLAGCNLFAPDPHDRCIDDCETACDERPGSCEPSAVSWCQQKCAVASGPKNESESDEEVP